MAGTIYGLPSDGSLPERIFDAARVVVDEAKLYKLGPLYAGLSARTSAPVAVVTIGSSTTAGNGANSPAERWVNRLATRLQSLYPSGTGSESAVGDLSTAPITTPGVHVYNGGVGGTTSSNYLTDAMVAQIGPINPRAVVHQIGSNDMAQNMTLATYRTNMVAAMDKLDAAIAGPVVHVLLHAQPRTGDFLHSWDEYGRTLRDLAEDRENAFFLDSSRDFSLNGVPSPDPLDLLGGDNIHLTNSGHAFMGAIVARDLGLSVPTTGSGAAAPAVKPGMVSVRSSDAAVGVTAATAEGRVFDNELGGSRVATWVGNGLSGIALAGGTYVGPTSSNGVYVLGAEVPVLNYEFSLELTKLPTTGPLYIEARRYSGTSGSPGRDLRLVVEPTGGFTLAERNDELGMGTRYTAPAGTVTPGRRVGIRALNDLFTYVIDGVPGAWYTMDEDNRTIPGFACIVGTDTSLGYEFKRPVIAAVLA